MFERSTVRGEGPKIIPAISNTFLVNGHSALTPSLWKQRSEVRLYSPCFIVPNDDIT